MPDQGDKTIKLENGYNMTFKNASHKYLVDGEYIIGVSSILDMLNKPALLNWKVREVKDNINVLGAGDAFAACFISNMLNTDDIEKSLEKAHEQTLKVLTYEN